MGALMKVAQKGHLDVFRLLLEQKAAPDAKDDYGWTPMMWASLEGNMNILEFCVNELMMVVDQTNEKGEGLLQKAATNGHSDVCKFLIKQGAKVNAHDSEGQSSLMWAASNSHLETVELLLQNEAKVDME